MPVSGLPTMLECIINNILEESQLASYKIAGNGQRTTLVLRFDAMIDTGVLNFHQSTPANNNCHRKSPSKIQRDNRRLQQFRTSLPKEKTDKTNLPNEKTTFEEKNTQESVDTTVTKTTHNSLLPAMCDSGIHSLPSVLDMLDETTAHNTEETDSLNSSQGSETEVTTNIIHSTVDQHNNKSDCDDTPSQEVTHDYETEQETSDYADYLSLCRKFLNGDKIQVQSQKIKRDMGLLVTQSDRNNKIIKLCLDSYGPSQVFLAETDDLIVEFNVDDRKITNFIIKNSDHDSSPYANMRRRHMATWTNNLQLLQEEYHDTVLGIMRILPLLKRWINECLP